MSSINLPRIKQIRQKTADEDYTSLPIGSQGKYIDISSGLDLEEELKLGGNHRAQIRYQGKNSYITEYYYAHSPNSIWKYEENNIVDDQANFLALSEQQGSDLIAEFLPKTYEQNDNNLLYIVRTDIIEEDIGQVLGVKISNNPEQLGNLIVDENSKEQIYDYYGKVDPHITSILYKNRSENDQFLLHTKEIDIQQDISGDYIKEDVDI